MYEAVLTTVIGMKCKDGIVLCSDSQGSYEKGMKLKRFDVTKILAITNKAASETRYAIAGSGIGEHIKILTEGLVEAIADKRLDDKNLRVAVEDCVLKLHKRYNVDRSRFLGYDDVKPFFHPKAIVGAKLQDVENNSAYGLYTIQHDGWIFPIEQCETIGSGAPLADFLLKEFLRGMTENDNTWQDVTVEQGCEVCSFVMEDVKKSDIQSGGDTKIAIIDSRGFTFMDENEVKAIFDKVIAEYSNIVSQSGQISYDVVSKALKSKKV